MTQAAECTVGEVVAGRQDGRTAGMLAGRWWELWARAARELVRDPTR